MVFLSEKQFKYIYLIALIFMQIFVSYSDGALIKCIQCGGNITACAGNEEPKDCSDEKYQKCFTKVDSNGAIERGCLLNDAVDNCKIDATTNCVVSEAALNNQRICKKCEGSDAKCSQTDMTENAMSYNQICATATTNCYRKVENKLVVRGCDTDNNIAKCTTTDANTCDTCSINNCNTGIFPTNRLNCYQCSGDTCKDVSANDGLSKPCHYYEANQKCYSNGDTRGCKSDTTENKCSSDNAPGCSYCNTTNCNNETYSFTCIRCRSDIDIECKNEAATKFKGETCPAGTSSDTDGCFYGVWHDVVIRGCLINASPQDQAICKNEKNSQCTFCNTKDCNTKKSSGSKNGLSYSLIMIVFITLWKFK